MDPVVAEAEYGLGPAKVAARKKLREQGKEVPVPR